MSKEEPKKPEPKKASEGSPANGRRGFLRVVGAGIVGAAAALIH